MRVSSFPTEPQRDGATDRGSRGVARPTVIASLALVYFIAGKLGLSLAVVHASASPVWPPTGLALAALLILGKQVWPALFVGAFLVNLTTAGNAATSIGIAIGNTLEGVIGAWLVERFASGSEVFDRPRNVFTFLILACLGSTLISASVGVTSLALGGFAAWRDYGLIWSTWWLADAAGAVLVTPALILWTSDASVERIRARPTEAGVLALLVVLVGAVLFGAPLPSPWHATSFLCLLLVVWPAFRFGRAETAGVVLILSAMAIWGTLRQFGPFASADPNQSLIMLQIFLGVIAATGLLVSSVVLQQQRGLRALERQAEELSRANVELKEFAHVVSHDLKAPLRGISSLASWIAEDCKGLLPDESRDHLALLEERTHRMAQLIDGVLAYSRVGRSTNRESVDSRRLVEQVIDTVGAPVSVQVEIEGSLPTVFYDRTQLGQVFQNLIENAVQHLGRPAGRVVVSCRELEDAFEFSVSDDGAGIPVSQRERIFRIFHVLDPRGGGTGVGLSIVKRIVESNHGRVSVESEEGAGTCFRFLVPKP